LGSPAFHLPRGGVWGWQATHGAAAPRVYGWFTSAVYRWRQASMTRGGFSTECYLHHCVSSTIITSARYFRPPRDLDTAHPRREARAAEAPMTWTGAIQTRRRPTTRSKPASRPGKGGGPALLVTPCPYHLADPAAVWTLWTPPWGLGCATRRPADLRGDCGEGDLGGKGQVRSFGPDRLCGVRPRGAHGLAEGVVGGGGARCCEQSWPGDTFHNSSLALHRGSPPGTCALQLPSLYVASTGDPHAALSRAFGG